MYSQDELNSLLEIMIRETASDLILTQEQPPILRINGDLSPVPGWHTLSSDKVWQMVAGFLNEEQKASFLRDHELDTSFGVANRARFRLNVFRQRGAVCAVMRMLPHQIPTIESLGLSPVVKSWLEVPHGLLITTGPTGSGKSTSQAAMIGYLNQRKPYHIVTIEDPIEFVHSHGTCTIEQRGLGEDTRSFGEALKRVFRQSPDVIMIGEMRDRETFETALELAETGHLVLATLHTGDAAQAISRIIDVFPSDEHEQIRVQLSLALIGIIVQQLVPRVDGRGRVLAVELLQATSAIRNLIRKNDLQQIYSVVQTSSAEGMTTMNDSLLRLFREGHISLEQAVLFTSRRKELEQMVSRIPREAAKLREKETARV